MSPPSLTMGGSTFLNRKFWDDSAHAEYVTWEIQQEEVWMDGNEWLQAE